MVGPLLLATTLLLQVQAKAQVSRDSTGKEVSLQVRIGGASETDSNKRIPVTAAHLATAFHDPLARTMLIGARVARLRQDSALRTYDAKIRQRISVGMNLKASGRDRLVMRDEGVARVQWQRDVGAVVDLLGKRTTVPVADDPEQIDQSSRSSLQLPIPYFPGRETLWIGASIAQTSVDQSSFVHPIATGAEAYYKYSSGDSVSYTLPDGKIIMLKELRVEARQPHWNVIVGSFWFDQASWQLVRAVYRPSIEMDIWQVAAESAERDTTNKDDDVPWWVKGLVSPMKASMNVFTVEYSLFEGRFWLPVSQGAEGKLQAMMLRVPVNFEERVEYTGVNGPVDVVKPMAAVRAPALTQRQYRDSLAKAGADKATIDSLAKARRVADSTRIATRAKTRQDSIKTHDRTLRDSMATAGLTRKVQDSIVAARSKAHSDSVTKGLIEQRACEQRGTQTQRRIRAYNNSVDVLLRVPCDLRALAHSPELPASAYDPNEEVFGTKQRDELMHALDFGLQAGWGPQKPAITWGFSQSRYNRVEGFSTGIGIRQELGAGYTWSGVLRGSQGDRQLGGEAGIERSNGRSTMRLNAYRRLVSASDWGTPLSFSSSFPALLYGRDEGVYYRAWGAELLRTTDRNKRLDWRVFAEHEWTAERTTRFSLFGGSHDRSLGDNVVANAGNFIGGSVRWRQSWGLAPRGWKTFADLRLEGAGGTLDYGRGALDLSVSRALFGPISFGILGAGGTSVGDLPAQRQWFLGGAPTVRGQVIGVDSAHAGNAFWFARTELARDRNASRWSLFADLGWAGDRSSDWGRSQRLLSGVGIGSSFLQGLMRFDLSRGLWPRQKWRLDFSLDAPF
ncbi:MAG TPA: hypothetical protein VE967_14010 [Gemmatimonadaceae bacterium]|nr:hypothetical protein [Gemmatimonadaceae bacterium]